MSLKKMIFLFLILFLFPFSVSANSLSCPQLVTADSVISCRLKIDNVSGVNANYNIGTGFSVLDFTLSGNWKTYYKDKVGFAIGNIIDSKGVDAIIKIKLANNLELNKNYSIGIVNIDTVGKDGKLYEVDDINTSVKVVSNDAYLSELSLDNIEMVEKFSKDNYVYHAETLVSDTVIHAKTLDNSAKISGDIGKQVLNYGINLFSIRVTSAYGIFKDYKIYVTRDFDEDAKDSLLKSISLSSGKIDFKKDKFLYEISVNNSINTIDVSAVANSSKSVVEISKPDELVIGENEIVITVTAVDGTQSKYVLLVTREDVSNEVIVKKDKTSAKITIFVVTAILVIVLLIILVKVIQNFIKFIKNNKF